MYLWGRIDTYDQILVERRENLIEELLSHVEVGVDGIVVLGVPLIFAFEWDDNVDGLDVELTRLRRYLTPGNPHAQFADSAVYQIHWQL